MRYKACNDLVPRASLKLPVLNAPEYVRSTKLSGAQLGVEFDQDSVLAHAFFSTE